jgi:hypothetical protein
MLTLIRNITAAFFKLKYVYVDEYLYERARKLNTVANVEMGTDSRRYSRSVSCRHMCAHKTNILFLEGPVPAQPVKKFSAFDEVGSTVL